MVWGILYHFCWVNDLFARLWLCIYLFNVIYIYIGNHSFTGILNWFSGRMLRFFLIASLVVLCWNRLLWDRIGYCVMDEQLLSKEIYAFSLSFKDLRPNMLEYPKKIVMLFWATPLWQYKEKWTKTLQDTIKLSFKV